MAARFHALISDFCFGETSPRVRSRVSGGNIFGISPAEVYRSGCRDVTNNIILPQGGAYRREGFRFGRDTTTDAPAGISNGPSYRQFTLTTELADLILLLTPAELWVYQLPSFTVIAHLPTPYNNTDLNTIGITQWERNVVIFSAGHRPRLLKWDAGFTFTDPGQDFIAPLYPYHDARSPQSQTGSWKLDIPEATFSPGVSTSAGFSVSGVLSRDAGGLPAEAYISLDGGLSATNIQDNLNNFNAAVITGTAVVTYDGTTATIMHYTVEYQFKATVGDASGRLASPFTTTSLIDGQSGAEPLWSGPLLVLRGSHYYECIFPHISAVSNEPVAGGSWTAYWVDRGTTVPTDRDYDVALDAWALERSYSQRNRGWPSQMTFHEQRLAGTGPLGALSVIAASRLTANPNIFDFTLGVDDNDGLLFKLTGGGNCIIRWLLSSEALYIGTSAGVFVQTAQPWTPTNIAFRRINGYASSLTVRAIEVEGEVFFPTVDDRQIRQISFSNDLQSWQSFDLTAFAEHLYTDRKRIRQLVTHQGIDTIVWAIRTDGALMGLTYSPAYHTVGWHKHSLSDPVLQVSTAFDGNKVVLVALIWRRIYRGGAWASHPCLETLDHTSQNLFDVEPAMFDETQLPSATPDGFTPFTPELPDLLIPTGLFDLNSYGASPAASAVTNLAALKAATNALSTAGGGTLMASIAGTYKIYAPGTLSAGMGAMHTFVNLSGVMINLPGVRFQVEDSFDPGEVLVLFQFLNVQNITIRVLTGQPKDNAMHLNQAGLALAAFGTRCSRVLIENVDMDGGYAVCLVGRDPSVEDDANYCHDFTIRNVTDDQVFYPYSFQNSGDTVSIQNCYSSNCGRAYFMYGCKNQDIAMTVDNPDHSPTVIVTTGGSAGRSSVAENVRLRISSAGQRALQANLVGIYPSILDIADPRPQRLSNFDIGFPSVDMVTAAPLYGIFTLPKVAWNYGIDTVPARGHIIENIVVGQGTINGAVNRGEVFSLCAEGNWAGETVRNVRVANLMIAGAPTTYIHVNLDPFVDPLVFENVFTPSDIVLTGTGPDPIYRNTDMGGVGRDQGFYEDIRAGRVAWEVVVAAPAAWSVHLDSHEQVALVGLAQPVPARFALRQVGVVANGVYLGSYQVDATGHILLTSLPAGSMWVGFEFPARLEPNRFEAPVPMTAQSQKIRWVNPVMRLLTSAMPLMNGHRANERKQDALYNEATGLITGDVVVSNLGSDGRIVIEADLPLPCHLTGIFGLMTTEEG